MLRKGMSSNDGDSPFRGWEPFRWIRVGPGVVGRTVPVVVCFTAVLGVAIWKLNDPFWIVWLAVIGATVVSCYFGAAFWYANKYPDFSTLDGGSLVDYRRAQLGAKDPKIIEVNPEIVPNTSPPQLPSKAEEKDGV